MSIQTRAREARRDADFSELFGEVSIGDEPRRIRTDGDPGQQVPHDWRKPSSLRQVAKQKGTNQATRESQDKVERMHLS